MADEPTVQQAAEAQQKEVVIETTTGQVFKGKDYNEVLEKMKGSIESGSQTLRQYKDDMEALRQQVDELRKPAPTSTTGFDKQKYFALLTDNPVEAQNYLDEHRYGEKFDTVREKFQRSSKVADEVSQLMEINKFQQTLARIGEEYPGTPEVADDILRKLGKRPVSAENLMSAYIELKGEGKIKVAPKKEDDEPGQRRKPPASAKGGGEMQSFGGKRAEEMTADQIKAEIEKLQRANA